MTMEAPTEVINPITGHMEESINADDAALYRAIGLDQPDLPIFAR
jgi:hypothetical protein